MTGYILIAENDPALAQIMKDTLDQEGHSVVTAFDIKTAMHMFEMGSFDVVLADVALPGMPCSDFMDAIKSTDASIQIIALTRTDHINAAEKLVCAGAFDLLTIPDELVRPYRLQMLVKHALEKRQIALLNQSESDVQATDRARETAESTKIYDDISRILAENETLPDATVQLISTLLTHTGWKAGALWRMDDAREAFRCIEVLHTDDKSQRLTLPVQRGNMLLSGDSVPEKVHATGHYVIGQVDVPDQPAAQSVGFPILIGNTVVGVVELFNTQNTVIDDALIRLMATVGYQVGVFIECEHMETQLRQSQKIDAIGRMAGSIVHDFNNILSSIIGHIHLVEMDINPESKTQQYIKQVKDTSSRAVALIQQLLAFGRNQTMQLERMDLNNVVYHLEPALRQLLDEQIGFSIDLEDTTDQVLMDRTQLEQIVTNLVVNARDAMPDGGALTMKTRTVTLNKHEARLHNLTAGTYIRMDIKDTGEGMDETVQARIFEPFFTTKGGRGTGLGLATVYGIMSQNGGTIRVSSKLGEGTTFSLFMPLLMIRHKKEAPQETAGTTRETVPTPEEAQSASSEIPEIRSATPTSENQGQTQTGSTEMNTASEQTSTQDQTLLIVDDEENLRFIARDILEQHGYKVLEAENGVEALKQINQSAEDVNLIVTDLIMPEMDGIELIERIRPLHPHMKYIMISGSTDKSLLDQYTSDNNIPLLAKPFNIDQLATCVQDTLRASGLTTNTVEKIGLS